MFQPGRMSINGSNAQRDVRVRSMRQYEAVWRHGTSILRTMVCGAALVCSLLAVAMLALQLSGLSEKRIAFDTAGIKAVDGNGFVYTLSVSPPFPGMVLQSDDAS